MRHSTQLRSTAVLAVVILGMLALLMTSVASASRPQSSTLGREPSAQGGKQLALGTITSFSPASVVAGSGSFTLTMGLNPTVAAVPTWTGQWDGPSGVFALSGLSSIVNTSVSGTVPAGAVTAPGLVTVTVSDGTTAWSGAYTVTSGAPHIDSIDPVSTAAGGSSFTLRVNGSNFATGVSAAYVTWNGIQLPAATPTGPINPTAILYATVPTTAIVTPGTATVKVVNPNLGGGVESNGVTFSILGPTISAIVPATGTNADSALSFVLNGTNLDLAGAPRTVTLKGVGSNAATVITATGVTYEPPLLPGGQGRIVGTLNLANISGTATPVPAPPGKYDVVFTFVNGGIKTLTLAEAFSVTGPSLTAINPVTATNGQTSLVMTLTGTSLNTLTTPAVTLKGPGTTGTTVITATGVSSVAPGTTMTCSFNLTSPTVAPAGAYDVIVTYAGTKTLTKAQSFAVTNASPIVTAVTPSSTWAGSVKPTTLTITGSGFVPVPPLLGAVGSRVQIGARLTTDTTFVSATQLTVPLTAADIAAAGTVQITVVNPTPGGGTSAAVPLTVGTDTTPPVTTVSGADASWHNTPVTLTVAATDAQSGVQTTQWAQNGGAPTTLVGSTITVQAPAGGGNDGAHTITVWSTDWCNRVETPPVSVTVNIDTVGPRTTASAPSSVKKDAKVKFGYKASDVAPKCNVTLKIKKSNGTVARTYGLGQKTSNKSYTYTVNPNLEKGKYTLYTYAKDLAGNAQSKLGTDTFTVK